MVNHKRVGIVGHGPSLLGAKYGEHIDQNDIIIRLKWHKDMLNRPERFGSKTDIVCCSWIVAPNVRQYWPDVGSFFIFSDSRTQSRTNEDIQALQGTFQGTTAVLDKALCDFWDEQYRNIRDTRGLPGHDHTSAGLHAIMYACKYLNPCVISLYGFDSVLSGEWTWSLTRGPDWDKYPDHLFQVEHDMLPMFCSAYMVEFEGYTTEDTQ